MLNNIKTDISFKADGKIELSAKVVKALGIKPGDAINFTWIDEECYLYVAMKAIQNISCKGKCIAAKKGSNYMRTNWKQACKIVLPPNINEARYRVGECIEIGGKPHLSIITRKHYATERN